MKQNTKQNILFLFVALAIVFVFPLLSATVTLNVPAASGNYSTIIPINCTTLVGDNMSSNATIWYNNTVLGVTNTSAVTIANTTVNQTTYTNSLSIAALADGNASYRFWCQVVFLNNTQQNSSINTGITIDNSIPTCTLTLAYPSINANGIQTYGWTISDPVQIQNASETFTGPTGFTTRTSTNTTGLVNLASTENTIAGQYTLAVTAFDSGGNSCTASKSYMVSNGYAPGSVGASGGS